MVTSQMSKGKIMEEFDRRKFLKATLSTAAALSVPISFAQSKDKKKKPITRVLGKTGLRIPVISYGVMLANNPALLRAAYDAGITHFDTAHSYQNGRNEEMIGEVLSKVPRKSYILATKIKPAEHDRTKGTIGPASTKEAFLNRLDISLKRLKTDYVDILYLHGISTQEEAYHPEMLAALEEAKKSGKTHFIGVSTHRNVEGVLEAVTEEGIHDVVLASINFQNQNPKRLREVTAAASKAGIGIIAMKTMAGGYYDKERTKPVNYKAALKWVLEDPAVTTCIAGLTAFEHLQENISVNYDITLTDEERASLIPDTQSKGMACDGCEQCIQSCRYHLSILPDAMRAYMYTYGYGATLKAREIVDEGKEEFQVCKSCDICSAHCVKNLPISERVKDVARLENVPIEFLA
ncbi:MAG TPA: aldo/keto reductase [Bacteroidota bacterium]|nr:aldo/keto reductase [Bacteroidota bacterium]